MSFEQQQTSTFFLPQKIISSIEGLESLFEFREKVLRSKHEKVIISFENVVYFSPPLCAVLGAMFEEFEHQFEVEFEKESVKRLIKLNRGILVRNSFVSRLLGRVQKRPLAVIDRELSYDKFSINDDEKFYEYIQNEIFEKPNFKIHSEKLKEKIQENIFEIFENARTHGKCQFIHTSGLFRRTRLSITIVDLGISIVKNIRKHFADLDISSSDCIDWAMKKGNTTKKGDIPGGLGLNIIYQFINLNGGRVQIISSDGYWELKSGRQPIQRVLNFKFNGTIAILDFNLEDKRFYHFDESEEETNFIF